MNNPYVKHTVNGEVINPVTAVNPVVSAFPNRRMRRMNPGRSFSNKKGIQLVVTRIGVKSFIKYQKKIQNIPAGTLEILIPTESGADILEIKHLPAKTLTHAILVN